MGADRVEVAQQHYGPARIGLGEIPQYLFHHQLGAAIGVGRAGGKIFPQRHRGGIAIDGSRGAEHQPEHAGFGHLLAQHQGAGHVVLVVGERYLARLPHRLEAGEVDHRFNLVGGEQPLQAGPVENIALDEGDRLAGDPLDPLERLGRCVGQVIQHHHPLPRIEQLDQSVGADIASAARDQYCHFIIPCSAETGTESTRPPPQGKDEEINDTLNTPD
ncbi:hypothetical protein D3C85_821340 [compost metagenome]